jgi:acyl-CoA reductase-like NAD-dependent aldehyde dehydrogenase
VTRGGARYGPRPVKLLIGGELVEGEGESLAIEEPARAEAFASVSLPSAEQVDAAIAAESELAPKDWWYPYGGGAPPHG